MKKGKTILIQKLAGVGIMVFAIILRATNPSTVGKIWSSVMNGA
jgi:hypothetical protein